MACDGGNLVVAKYLVGKRTQYHQGVSPHLAAEMELVKTSPQACFVTIWKKHHNSYVYYLHRSRIQSRYVAIRQHRDKRYNCNPQQVLRLIPIS